MSELRRTLKCSLATLTTTPRKTSFPVLYSLTFRLWMSLASPPTIPSPIYPRSTTHNSRVSELIKQIHSQEIAHENLRVLSSPYPKSHGSPFQPADEVVLTPPGRSIKFHHSWSSPYDVVQKTSLQCLYHSIIHYSTVHFNRLLPYAVCRTTPAPTRPQGPSFGFADEVELPGHHLGQCFLLPRVLW